MSKESPTSSDETENAKAPEGRKIKVLLGLAIGAWFLATLAMAALCQGELFQVFECFAKFWPINFLIGGAVLLLATAGLGLAKRISAWASFSALGAYFVPVTILVLSERIITAFWDNPLASRALADGLVPLAVYIVSFFAASIIGRKSASDFLLSFAVPPIVLSVVAGGLSAFMVFSSDAFIYRDAFGISVKTSTLEEGNLDIEGVLHLKKDGDFTYEAVFYRFDTPEFEDGQGELQWVEGTTPNVAGDHPFTLSWSGVRPRAKGNEFEFPEAGPNLIIRKSGNNGLFLKSFSLGYPVKTAAEE